MSDERDNDTEGRRSDPTDERLIELPASVRGALGAWAETYAAPDPTLIDRVMAEVVAMERAEAWADAFVPELPADFAQMVTDAAIADDAAREASRRAAMNSWAEDMVPELPADFAQRVAAAALAEGGTDAALAGNEAAEAAPGRPSGVVEKVVPLAPRRRWVAPAALSSLVAAAAVAVFSLAGPGRTPTSTPETVRHTQPHTTRPINDRVGPESVTTNATGTNASNATNSTRPNGERNPTTDELGSEVEKVEVDGDLASFTAFSIVGEDDHSTVAVVWIDDGVKQSPTVQ